MKNPPSKTENLQKKDGRLICPVCRELLSRQDIESYVCCPFCDYKFSLNQEMEDYLLTPVVENWCQMNSASQSLPQFPEQDDSRSSWL